MKSGSGDGPVQDHRSTLDQFAACSFASPSSSASSASRAAFSSSSGVTDFSLTLASSRMKSTVFSSKIGARRLLLQLGVLAVELQHLALLAGIAHRLAHDGLVQLLGRDVDRVGAPDIGQQQTQANPALGDLAVLLLHLLFVVLDLLARLLGFLDALPDGVELALDQALGHLELVGVGELVEKLALDHRARDLRVVLADTLGRPPCAWRRGSRSCSSWRAHRRPACRRTRGSP